MSFKPKRTLPVVVLLLLLAIYKFSKRRFEILKRWPNHFWLLSHFSLKYFPAQK